MPFPDHFDLHGQTALVTGATRGIGKSMALALAEAGSDVILVQRDESNTNTRDEIRALGRTATIYTADLAHRDQIKGLVKKVLEDGHDISILINCGGIQRRHPADQFPDEDWDEVRIQNYQMYTICLADVCVVGNESEPGRSICSSTRYRRLHAHEATSRESAPSGIDHKCCLTGVLPGWTQCSCVRRSEKWCRTAYKVFEQPMGVQRHQRQRCNVYRSLLWYNHR